MNRPALDTPTLLERLIGYPTVSRSSNLELIDFAANYLDDLGARTTIDYNADRTRANLHAVIGPDDTPGIVLSGHSDVVPVDGQDWRMDPFVAKRGDARVYGRGSADMKGFLAAMLALAPAAAKRRLRQPLHFVFSYDEEIGCVGVRSLIDTMRDWPVRPRFCIVGEPTAMRPAIAHKGKVSASCHCRGVPAHSALPDLGVSAIHLAADVIAAIRRIQREVIEHGRRDDAYAVPYTTLHVGTITGGTALNIVPEHCRFDFEIRHLPADDSNELLARLDEAVGELLEPVRSTFAAADIRIEITNQYPALETVATHDAVSMVKRLTGIDEHDKLAFGTEGGLFQQQLDLPTVVCGPGSMDQGHKRDEYVTLEQLDRCDRFLARLLNEICTTHGD